MFETIKNFFDPTTADRIKERWGMLENEEQVQDLIGSSNQSPQVIYKHSTRCSVSFFALQNLQSLSEEAWGKADYHMLDVISSRSVSQFVSEKLGVRHESPQVLVLKDGEVVWDGSHYQVKAEAIEAHL